MAVNFSEDVGNTSEKAIAEITRGFFNIAKWTAERGNMLSSKSYRDSGYGRASMQQLLELKGDTICVPVSMSDQHFREFCSLASRNGLVYACGVRKGREDKREYAVWCKNDKQSLVKDCLDQLTVNIKLREINKEIEKLQKEYRVLHNEMNSQKNQPFIHKNSLPGNDKEASFGEIAYRINDIQKQIEVLQKDKDAVYAEQFDKENRTNNGAIYEEFLNGKVTKQDSYDDRSDFNKTLNRLTNEDYMRSDPIYAADRTNPDCYLELRCERDRFKGEEYTKTSYAIYQDNQLIKNPKSQDGRWADVKFEGRPPHYLQNLKEEMMENGRFRDGLVVFNQLSDLNKYQKVYSEELAKQRRPKLQDFENGYKDYGQVIQELKENLEQKGYEVRNDNSKGYELYKDNEKIQVPVNESKGYSIRDLERTDALKTAEIMTDYQALSRLQNEKADLDLKYKKNQDYINTISSNSKVQEVAGEVTTDQPRTDTPYELQQAQSIQTNVKNQIQVISNKMENMEHHINCLRNEKNTLSSLTALEKIDQQREQTKFVKAQEEKSMNVDLTEEHDSNKHITVSQAEQEISNRKSSFSKSETQAMYTNNSRKER